MKLVYDDEAGDDGYPEYSSPIFVLSALYLAHEDWKETFGRILNFRRELKASVVFPVRLEMHTRHFLLNKNPYHPMGLAPRQRQRIVGKFCQFLATLPVRVVNISILKPLVKRSDYQVLDRSMTYSVQRIENDLGHSGGRVEPYMILTDTGRHGKMRRTTRKMQRVNYIPSILHPGSYRKEIEGLIEDPLPKESDQSYFIQFADLVSFVVYMHTVFTRGIGRPHRRLRCTVDKTVIREWIDTLKPVLNLAASRSDAYGIVYQPKE